MMKKIKCFWKNYGRISLIMICISLCMRISVAAAQQSLLQHGIAEEVLRFHVLAQSDSREDQQVKLLVRDRVLEWINRQMGAEAVDKVKMKQFISCHIREIEAEANHVLAAEQMNYRAKAALETCYFPDRTYGDCTFPAGWYEALRIQLGRAQGHNWWCVLYPRLCFSDCLSAVVEEEQKTELKSVLTEEEYESLLHSPGKWHIKFRWF